MSQPWLTMNRSTRKGTNPPAGRARQREEIGMMWRIRQWLSRFMYGRYGLDTLSYVLMGAYFVIYVISSFTKSPVLVLLSLAVLIWCLFRILSRNIARRRKENDAFLRVFRWLKRSFTDRDRKYVRCPNCRATLRLPRRRGKHTATCPACGSAVPVRIWFGKR